MVVCLQIHALLCFKFLYILDDGLLIDSSLFIYFEQGWGNNTLNPL